jgi:hypothetical protein
MNKADTKIDRASTDIHTTYINIHDPRTRIS